MILLDGKKAAASILEDIGSSARDLRNELGREPHLAVILVGNDGASETYVANKVRTCEEVGIRSSLIRFGSTVSQNELSDRIRQINEDKEVDGLIVQSPLPDHIDFSHITSVISPSKDVDGFNPVNTGRMVQNIPSFIAATPKGILMLIKHYGVPTKGKKCVVIGRSNIVGMPVSILLARNNDPGNCTVTICHSRTTDLKDHTRGADIVIAALGKPGFLTRDMISEGATVIDVGITRVKDSSRKSGYRLQGDADFDQIADKCAYITPVPGGVGPMTIAGLLSNTISAAGKEFYTN
jgi:methylenetetrahydrofolate dehydrogenase (NADP+)/methenyltetrahydrofolate cyclohydrolase